MIRMLLPQRRISWVIWMFQDSLFKQKPCRSTTVWPAARDPASRTDSRTPSLVVTMRLQVSDRRAPGIRLRLHRVGGVVAVLSDMAVFGRARVRANLSVGVALAVVSCLLSSCGHVARFVEDVCGAVYFECVLPKLADDVQK